MGRWDQCTAEGVAEPRGSSRASTAGQVRAQLADAWGDEPGAQVPDSWRRSRLDPLASGSGEEAMRDEEEEAELGRKAAAARRAGAEEAARGRECNGRNGRKLPAVSAGK